MPCPLPFLTRPVPLPYIHFTYVSLRLPVRGTHALEIKEIFVRQLPHDGSRDALVIVAQQVPDAGDLLPRNLQVAYLQVVGQVMTGFGNDLDAALDEPLLFPLRLGSSWNLP